jgi:hypothetical protein
MARSRFVIKMVNTYDSKPNISDNLHQAGPTIGDCQKYLAEAQQY